VVAYHLAAVVHLGEGLLAARVVAAFVLLSAENLAVVVLLSFAVVFLLGPTHLVVCLLAAEVDCFPVQRLVAVGGSFRKVLFAVVLLAALSDGLLVVAAVETLRVSPELGERLHHLAGCCCALAAQEPVHHLALQEQCGIQNSLAD